MVLSIVLGTLIAVARLSLGRTARIPLVGLVELLRGAPVVILVYLCVRVLPDIGLDFRAWYGGRELWGLVIGLTAVQHGDLRRDRPRRRASLPRGQREAALATGLTHWQTMRLVLLPQAFRVMLPAIISQLVVVLKDTSLVAFVGNYDELLEPAARRPAHPRQPDPDLHRRGADLHRDQLRAEPARAGGAAAAGASRAQLRREGAAGRRRRPAPDQLQRAWCGCRSGQPRGSQPPSSACSPSAISASLTTDSATPDG